MKRVLVFIICTFSIVLIADIVFGVIVTNYVKSHHLPGRFQPLDKLIRQTDAEILLIGNSVIQDAINPQIVEDSMKLSCYNGGIAGQDPFFFETVIDCIFQRHIPQIIVLGLRPEELGENIGDGIFDVLKPYYHIGFNSIDEHFDNMSPDNRLLLKSSFYRFNSIWVRILLYSLFDDTIYTNNGFIGGDIPAQIPTIQEIDHVDKPSERKLNCLKRIINKCKEKGVKIYICFPPCLINFPKDNLPCITTVKSICEQHQVSFFDDHNDYHFKQTPELFHDAVHLNINGAEIYSRKIASRLKKELNNKK